MSLPDGLFILTGVVLFLLGVTLINRAPHAKDGVSELLTRILGWLLALVAVGKLVFWFTVQ